MGPDRVLATRLRMGPAARTLDPDQSGSASLGYLLRCTTVLRESYAVSKPGVEKRAALADSMALLGTFVGAAIGVTLLLGSRDAGMALHGLLLVAACCVAVFYVLEFSFDSKPEIPTGFMDGPIKLATIAAVFWGIAGFVIGDVIAWQLAFPQLNLDLPWTSFGRLRPLHTSAVIFAFGGNILIGTSFYVVQRTCRARLA